MSYEHLIVPLATLVYLVVDCYPSVKSFRAIFKTVSFHVLWLVFVVLNFIGWAVLVVAAKQKLTEVIGSPVMANLALVILSTLSTLTLLQSLTLKIADYKFLDLGAILERFRGIVLADIGWNVTQLARKREQKLVRRMTAKFDKDLLGLRNEYAQIMSFGGQDLTAIGNDLAQLEQQADTNKLSFRALLAARMVKADPDFCERLVQS